VAVPVHAKKYLLRQVFRDIRVADDPTEVMHYAGPVFPYQQFEGAFITGARQEHSLRIGSIAPAAGATLLPKFNSTPTPFFSGNPLDASQYAPVC
jgi:hypothetical protein